MQFLGKEKGKARRKWDCFSAQRCDTRKKGEMYIFQKIAERRIREAMDNGLFENLPGQGRPLVFEDETWIPEDLRIAYRLLKNSGYLPPELELRNEIVNLKSLFDTLDDNKERLKKLREINFKLMKLNMMRKKPLNIEDFSFGNISFREYEDRILEKLISSSEV